MKLDIRKKVLLLVLSGILLTFLLFAVFFTFGLYDAQKALNSETDALSSSASEYAAELVEKQIQKHMEEITRVRAQDMNREMVEAAEDTKGRGCPRLCRKKLILNQKLRTPLCK